MQNIEIEIQVNIENSKPLLDFLEKNARFVSEKCQIDEYFVPAHRNFIDIRPVKEWLRLRNNDDKYSINYKNWHFNTDGKSEFCDEYESVIESLDQVKNILRILDFKPLVQVEKLRKIWKYKNYEIAVDTVKNLGDFVEIEYIGDKENVDPVAITETMISFLKKQDCGIIKRNYVGYPFQLLFPNEIEYEEQ